jgi:D-alanyl-D-alanine carboxypeptidase/D-alanyl-D-alanine-endopeptidase (penicillin-binding protein 4)
MKRLSALVFFILLFNLHPANAVDVLPEPFFKYLGSKYLANPGVILIDGSSNEIVYESGSDKPRTPASVLKVISASAMAFQNCVIQN